VSSSGSLPAPRTVRRVSELDPAMRRRVRAARVARLATIRPDGRPHVVPITFALVRDTIVTAVDHKPKATTRLQRLRNIATQPWVSVVVDHYDDDWSGLWWARADGSAAVVTGGAAFEAALDALAAKYAPYRQHRPSGPVVLVTVDRWTTWSASPRSPLPSHSSSR
jgi:PPOX class probable F420-dependent enzyme